MEIAIKTLEEKLDWFIELRVKCRRVARKKNVKESKMDDTFRRWARDTTPKIKTLQTAIEILKNY